MIKWRRKGYDFQNRVFLRQNSLAQTQGSDYTDAFIAKTYGKLQTFQPFQEFVFASTMKKGTPANLTVGLPQASRRITKDSSYK